MQDQPVENFHGMPENPFVPNVGQFHPSPGLRLVGNIRDNQGGIRGYQEQDYDFDQDEDQFSVQRSEPEVQVEDRKYQLLEERLKAVEGKGALGMDANDLGLVSGVKVPPKFKPPTFEKYNGTSEKNFKKSSSIFD